MKVALISPYEHLASYGIRMLAGCLKEAGHECKTLFLTQDFDARYTDEMLKDILEVIEPFSLVGMGVVTNHVHQVMQLSKAIRETYPEKKIIWGGIHATIEPDECLQSADMVCIGEGEEAIVELCNKMDSGADYTDVPNINLKIGDKIIKNAARPLVRDLDSFPFPDYELDDHYVLYRGRLRQMTAEFLNQNLGGQYVTMSSRGCTYKCTFCCNNVYIELYKGDRWFRKRSNENIVAELRMVKEKMPYIREIYFDDDAFLARSVRETQEFCDFYAREIALPFIVTGITPTSITEEKLELLVNAGLKWLRMGIQTASDKVNNELYKRPMPFKKSLAAIKTISKFQDRLEPPRYDFILDNPWESEEEILQTLDFLVEIPRPYYINLFSLVFYPGTELYERARTQGIVRDNFADVYSKSFRAYNRSYLNNLFMFFCVSNTPVWFKKLFINRWVLKTGLNAPLWKTYTVFRDLKARMDDMKLQVHRSLVPARVS